MNAKRNLNGADHSSLVNLAAAPAQRQLAPLTRAAKVVRMEPSPMDIVVLYEDAETKSWAAQEYERVVRFASTPRVTWWNINDLQHPGVLAGAVSMALRANVIVVASRATEGLPMPFYVWVKSWLPNRPGRPGTFIALLEAPLCSSKGCGRLREYLRATAQQARLNFRLEERRAGTCLSTRLAPSVSRTSTLLS
jgi:hypothetical protein